MKGMLIKFGIFLLVVFTAACGGDESNNNPNPTITIESNITPYIEGDPLDKVSIYIGSSFKTVDPDVEWLSKTKEKLDSMKYGEPLSKDDYEAIVQRQSAIQDKYDTRNEYYNQLKNEFAANILPHSAIEFQLESFCLNLNRHSPSTGKTYNEVVPIEEHIKKIMQWNYADGKSRLSSFYLQELIWGIQDIVHNGISYESALTNEESQYSKDIFGNNDKDFLNQMREKYSGNVVYQSKGIIPSTIASRDERAWLKETEKPLDTTKIVSSDNSSQDNYFNLGNGLIAKFSSKSSFQSAKLIVVNPTDNPIEFKPLELMLQTKGQSNIQPIALGVVNSNPFPVIDATEAANQSLNIDNKISEKPTCNISDQHRKRIIEEALPSAWNGVPYDPKNSRIEGVVCNQYVWHVYQKAGLPFVQTNTWGLPKSPFFKKIPISEAKDGDVVLWLNSSKNIHHMGIWVSNPKQYGGSEESPFLSARTHNGKSRPPTNDPNFVPTVDWTNPHHFGGEYTVYQYKGTGKDGTTCLIE